jgi:isopentenyl-diphosphate Delta-isomerase
MENEITANADPTQVKFLEERCILVNANDEFLGTETKRNCHLSFRIKQEGMLHRAFSVFLFNTHGELLLQQRSEKKITFPLHWANTCCSHPLATAAEMETRDNIGVKRAAVRKMEQELGISVADVPISSFRFITRVHYKAFSDDIWGEHEIDHVLFVRSDVTPKPNPNEVAKLCYLSKSEVRKFVNNAELNGEPISPWFRLIERTLLHGWWEALADIEAKCDPTNIYRLGTV